MNTPQPDIPAVRLENLVTGYNRKPLHAPAGFDVPKGTLNLIIGANGAGKSTLLHTVAGTLPPVRGKVLLNGNDIARMSFRERARNISLVYAERIASGGLTVKELVEMGRHPYTGFLGRLNDEDKEIVRTSMESVGIGHKAGSFLSDVSDGERQKAMIARALAQQSPIMMFDEPTNFLDIASRLEIMNLIARLVRENGITVLLSTHDIAGTLPLADNVVTILPSHPDEAMAIGRPDAPETVARLDSVFAGRNVGYDPDCRDYRLTTPPGASHNSCHS